MSVLYNSLCVFEDKQGYKYSCDMLRLQGLLSDDGYSQKDFERYFNNPTNMRISDTYICTGIGKYKYMWSITCQNTSVTVLYCFNGYGGNPDDKRRVILEFNPNKMNYDDFTEVHKVIGCLVELEVVRCDLAIDIPIARKYANLLKDNRNYEYLDYNKNGITEYLGTRNSTNFVKLYDKTKESSLDYDLTRLEFTCTPEIMEFKKHLPKVLIEQDNFQLELMEYDNLTKTNMAIIKALQAMPVNTRMKTLKNFGKMMRKKISPYVLADTYELKIDMNSVKSVFDWIKKSVYYRSFTINLTV